MTYTTLIDTESLAAHLADESCRIVDCRFALNDAAWGEQVYTASHIPGAVHADLKRHLAGHPTGRNGRHPLPPVDELRETFGRMGIDATRQVVAYDQDSGIFASRLWWMLRWLGHDAVAVLDGGFAAWVDAGHPVSSASEPEVRREFTGTPRADFVAVIDDVEAAMEQGGHRLVDARSPERFSGGVEPIDRGAGPHPGRAQSLLHEEPRSGGTIPAAGGAAPTPDGRPGRRSGREDDRVLRIGSHRGAQSSGDGTRRTSRSQAVRGVVERMVERRPAGRRERPRDGAGQDLGVTRDRQWTRRCARGFSRSSRVVRQSSDRIVYSA